MLEGRAWRQYVVPCRLVGFRPGEIPVFIVQAQDAYAANWLTQRFKLTAEKQMAGITGTEVAIEFRAPETVSADGG